MQTNNPSTAVPATRPTTDPNAVREHVREGYAKIARDGAWSGIKPDDSNAPDTESACCAPSCCGGTSKAPPSSKDTPAAAPAKASSCCAPTSTSAPAPASAAPASACSTATSGGGSCCGGSTITPDQLAKAIGYSATDLVAIPTESNMGLSCGNPVALASLTPGQTVLDLGSGGGFDCYIAGPKVGPTGRVIGVDMTPDMLTKARRNLDLYRRQSGLNNVEFRLGEIENLPVADNTIDVVISNCVLNLSPDKPQVWREIARVLKPGGRAAISDIALLQPLPPQVLSMIDALVGCVSGAVTVDEIRAAAFDAGLTDLVLTAKPSYIDAMTDWQDPLYKNIIDALPAGSKPSDYITSLDISARKPA